MQFYQEWNEWKKLIVKYKFFVHEKTLKLQTVINVKK